MVLEKLNPVDYQITDEKSGCLGHDLKKDCPVVIKPARSFVDQRVAERLALLWHPGLPRCLGSLHSESGLHYVFEYLPGQSLDQLMTEEGRIKDQLAWMIQWARALDFLHQQDEAPLLHLDLKPANLVVDSRGRAGIIDFGAARIMDKKTTLPGSGLERALTFNYAAPEQLAGKPCPASDIFSLGLVLLELLTGQDPEKCRSRPLGELVSGQPARLQMLIGRCLHTDPVQRFAQAAELAAELELLLAQINELQAGQGKPAGLHEELVPVIGQERNLPAALVCAWAGPEFACELAAVMGQEKSRSVLVIDADLLNPRADLLLGQPKRYSKLNTVKASGLGLALQAGQQERLTPQLLGSLCAETAIDQVKLLECSDLVGEYEYFQVEELEQVLRLARLLYDLVLVLCPRSIFDAFTCLCLLAADKVLVPLAGDLASFREVNRLLEFMAREYKMDLSRLIYVPFAYDRQNDLGQGTLNELCDGRLAGPISVEPERRKSLGTAPYAAKVSSRNRREYQRLIRQLDLFQSQGD